MRRALLNHIVYGGDSMLGVPRRCSTTGELVRLSNIKSQLHLSTLPAAEHEDVDYQRAVQFLRNGAAMDARQALAEGLRHHPSSLPIRRLLRQLEQALAPSLKLPEEIIQAEPTFAMLYDGLKGHTMLTWPRLFSLYSHMKSLTKPGSPPGDVVECGSAGGGSVVLMASTLAHYRQEHSPQRRVLSCDTFSGMPPPTANDALSSSKLSAADTHWSTGTCSGPTHHLRDLARAYNVEIDLVPGLFQDTLPQIAFPTGCSFLHSDSDWYESTRFVLNHMLPLMSKGGVVQVDDYHYWSGCRQAVDEVLDTLGPRLGIGAQSLQELDGNAVYVVIP